MKKGMMVLVLMLDCLLVLAEPQIIDVKAEPVSPWGKVAITYILSEDVVAAEPLVVSASNRTTEAVYVARSLTGDLSYKKGTHTIQWNMAKDNISLDKASVDFRVTMIEGVQLWKDGPYWANRNIGATKPEESGWYFWWGDTIGYKWTESGFDAVDGSKTGFAFTGDNSLTYKLTDATLKRNGYITDAGVLADKYDAAKKHWGENWRMPTQNEIRDLIINCTWTWTKCNGVNGYEVRGKGDYKELYIFLPAAGCGNGSFLDDSGFYWSSMPSSDSIDLAYNLGFESGYHNMYIAYRYYGSPVRAVSGFTK